MDKYKQIFEYNKNWVKEKLLGEKDFFTNLYKEQNPDFLYIGCSDSRVPANVITGLDIGDLFVHRNIANMIPNSDMNVMSVIQFAIEVLEVKHIVVCGHYGCGGVKASMTNISYGLLDNWLRNIRDVYRLHEAELKNIDDENKRYDRLVELNVIEQCTNVIKTAYLQKSYLKNNYPKVHGWVYDMKSGYLKDLNIDFINILNKVRELYNLGN
jgi:carbonic anhydrase